MAIIYTYPISNKVTGNDLLVLSDADSTGIPTKSVSLSTLVSFIQGQPQGGSGTTNKVVKFTDGPGGLIGDSSITETFGETIFGQNVLFNFPFQGDSGGSIDGALTMISGGPINLTDPAGAPTGVNTTITYSGTNFAITRGTASIIIDNTGNVGIGTNSPSSKLTVSGSTKLEGTGNKVFFGGNNTFVGENSNTNELILRGGGSTSAQSVFIDSAGRLSLGNANPTERLFLPDDLKIGLGTSADLKIYHDSGSGDSFINETGPGDLRIQAVDDVWIQGATNPQARFNDQGIVLYRLGVSKLETVSSGARIPQAGDGLQLVSPNGTIYTVTVDNSGNLVVT